MTAASRSVAQAAGPGKIRTHYELEAASFERRAAAIEGAQRDHLQSVAEQRIELERGQRLGQAHAERERRKRREALLLEHEGRTAEARAALREASLHRSEASTWRRAAVRAETALQDLQRGR